VYLGVWIALLVGTVITVAVSYFDFGSFNMVVAMVVATAKAALVALFFMHLYYDEKFNLVLFVASLVFVAIFFTFTSADMFTRGWIDPIKQNFVKGDPALDKYFKEPPPPRPTEGNLHPERHPAEHGAESTHGGEAPAAH
jgi:cytochrome c oxidase subunit 4